MFQPIPTLRIAAVTLVLLVDSTAFAHQGNAHATEPNLTPVETSFGRTGNPHAVSRTIEVSMHDTLRFEPAHITVRQGDTVRLVVRNAGKLLHELVLGHAKDLDEHAALMKKFPGMEHDEPYMAHVAAGKSGEIIWQFDQPGTIQFGCLIPGHYEGGMVGSITVEPISVAKDQP